MSTKTTSSKKINREAAILEAATEVFTRKGFAATTTRDIAEAANITLSSLHYYYRSKEKLFDLVAEKAMRQFGEVIQKSFTGDQPFYQKIIVAVESYIDLCIANPFLPIFVINEAERHPEKVYQYVDFQKIDQMIVEEMEQLIAEGTIRPMHPNNFIENLVGLTMIPFLTRNMRHNEKNRDAAQFHALLAERKKMVPEMLIKHMYYEPPL